MRLRGVTAFSAALMAMLMVGCASTVKPAQEAIAAAKASGDDSVIFKPIGQGAGGAFFAQAISPHDPKLLLAGTDMGCLFRSEDGGEHWSLLGSEASGDNPGFRGSWYAAFDPLNPDIAWAASEHGVFKSINKGKNWKLMTGALGGGPNAYYALAVDPADSNVVYISQGQPPSFATGWSRGRVWKTVDGGKSWTEQPVCGNSKVSINHCFVVIDPSSPVVKGQGHARVFVGGRDGLYATEDASKSWRKLNTGIPNSGDDFNSMEATRVDGRPALFLTVHPRTLDKATGAFAGGVYRSDDAGKTWRPLTVNDEKFMATLASINGRSGRGGCALFVRTCPADPKRLYLGSMLGVYRSDDIGATWTNITIPATQWYNFIDRDGGKAFFHLRRHGGNYLNSYEGGLDGFVGMTVCATDPDLVLYTDHVAMTATHDGGKTWEDLASDYDQPFDAGRFGDRPPMMLTHKTKSRGVQAINPNKIAVDPFDPNTIFIAYADLGLRISRDGGVTWEYPTRDFVGNRNRSQANAVVFDPEVKGRAYLNTATHGVVYVTEDGGRSFKDISIRQLAALNLKPALDKSFAGGVAVDRDSPRDKRTLYCPTAFGVYKSVDGGASWEDSSYGLADACWIKCLEISPANQDVLFAGVNPFGGKPNNPRAGLYRSDDAGKNWFQVGVGKLGAVYSVSICAARPEVMYVVANKPPATGSYWAKAALWRSDDGGETWKFLSDTGLPRSVVVSPLNPDYLYLACQAEKDATVSKPRLFRSKDGGKTWDNIGKGIPLTTPKNLMVYGPDPQRVFYCDEFSAYSGVDHGAPTALK